MHDVVSAHVKVCDLCEVCSACVKMCGVGYDAWV